MDWYAKPSAQVLRELSSNEAAGLSSQQAKRRLEETGENRLRQKKRKGLLRQFAGQFSDFMVLVLLAASAISFAAAILEENGDFIDPVIILCIVVLNAVIGVVQERRAERSLEALKQMSAPTALVVRDGRLAKIDAKLLVPGDILHLTAGDLVAADARVLAASGLRLQESALTGEFLPVKKQAAGALAPGTPVAERTNMVFSSSIVTAGNAVAVVCETGMQTQVGKIAHLLNEEETPQTPLQNRLARIGKLLGLVALGICAVIFAMGVLRKADLLGSFMLAVSLAVAAIPEGLPAIVTVVLSLGVQRMAKHNAIVRNLPAVETLGGATVICSDKTGTLTQNSMRVTAMAAPDGREPTGAQKEKILQLGALCNNAAITGSKSRRRADGEPTENALLLAADAVLDIAALRKQAVRVHETPFTSERKCMSTLHRMLGGYLLAVKGAPDVLLPKCTDVLLNGRVQPMSRVLQTQIRRQNEQMAGDALRVLAVCYREAQSPRDTAESDLVFCGLVGMQDPPRKEVFAAVRTCKAAVFMTTLKKRYIFCSAATWEKFLLFLWRH